MTKPHRKPQIAPSDPPPSDTLLSNAHAEQAMLGACLLMEPGVVDSTMYQVREQNLWFPTNRQVYAAIRYLWERRNNYSGLTYIEPLAVDAQMRELGTWNANTPGYLTALVTNTPCVANNGYYIEIVLQCSKRRALLQLHEAATDATHNGMPQEQIIAAVRKALDDIEREGWVDAPRVFESKK